ncbi:MAG: sigma factor-like helix-turn-helix DNA-binding protein [Acutalibacteraceae bacterium]
MHSCKVKVLYRLRERGIIVAKNLDVVLLADFYGEMLTENQRKFIEYYYSDDLSLSEIAQNEGITRQGVRDAVKRAETQLYDMEKKLGFAERTRKISEALEIVMENVEQINNYNMNISLSREVNDAVVNIKSAIVSLEE